MTIEFIDEMLKLKIAEDMKEFFEEIKSVSYKKLWDSNNQATNVLEILDNKEIHIVNGKISFDKGKTFTHRSEEKIIKEKFEEFEKEVIDFVYNKAISKSQKRKEILDRIEKTREGEESSIDAMFNSFANLSEDEQENVIDHAKIMLEIKVIDEQLDLLKEIGGNKEKVLSLLEQKHSLVKELRNI